MTALSPTQPLSEVIRHGLPFRQMLQYARQIADAVAILHRQGTVHGQLTSTNVHLTTDGAIVLKPGVGSSIDDLSSLRYAAPEQVRGEPPQPASDVWALGILLWEMSEGQGPFTGKSATDLRSAILYSPLVSPPLSWPEHFLAVAFRCLSKSPEGRYRDASALATALRTIPLTPREIAWARVRPALVASAAVISLLAIGFAAYTYMPARIDRSRPAVSEPAAAAPVPVRTIRLAVLPFTPLDPAAPDPALQIGLADAVISRVARFPGAEVRPVSIVRHYAVEANAVVDAGRALRVDYLVSGALQHVNGKLRASVRAVKASDGAVVWTEHFDADATGDSGVADAIAVRVAQSLFPHAAARAADEQLRSRTPNAEAFRLYLDGRYQWNDHTESGYRNAISYFQRATALDPSFAPAHAAMADSQTQLGLLGAARVADTFERARVSALQAVLTDDSLPDAHAALAMVKWVYDWNWEQAEREFTRALELNPGLAAAHGAFARFLASRNRFEDAATRAQQARALDPSSAQMTTELAEISLWAGRTDVAVAELASVVRATPEYAPALRLLGLGYTLQRRREDALRALERARQLHTDPQTIASLAYAHAVFGDRARAQALLGELTMMGRRRFVPSAAVALAHIGLGDHDQAFTWLERALHERADSMATLGVLPWFGPIRDDPRYQSLLAKVEMNRYH